MSAPTVDILLKSYPPDYPWLQYALRSIQRFATGFNDVLVILPRSDPLPLTAEKVILSDATESYLGQQVARLNADLHTEAEFVVNLDSDCVFNRPVTPADFMVNGKPRWLMTPWKDCPDAKKAWFHVMSKCLQESPEHEFMRRHGIIVPRWAYAEFRAFVEKTHGMTVEAYIMSQPGNEFSEFNAIGFYLWLHHRDAIHWHDTSVDGVPPNPIHQEWSHGGLTDVIRAKLEALLA